MIQKERILERLDMREYFAQFFPQVRSDRTEFTMCSPFRDEVHPSFALNVENGLWFDHGNGDSGDVFAFEQRRCNCDFPTALKNLARFEGISEQSRPDHRVTRMDAKRKTVNALRLIGSKADADRWNANMFSTIGGAAKEFLNARGLTDETLKQYLVGYDEELQAIVIPLDFKGNEIFSIKRMFFDGHEWKKRDGKKVFRNSGPATLYCAEFVRDAAAVNVVEGELDCLMLRQHGFDAVTGTAGAGTWRPSWSELLRDKDVTLVFDSDSAGRNGALKVAASLTKVARSVRILDLFPESDGTNKERKDVTDFFRLGGNEEQFRSILSRAITIECEDKIVDEEAGSNFSQSKIAGEILDDIDLIYVAGSFFTYTNGKWSKDTKRFAEREIKKLCGTRATRSLIESIKYLVSLECQLEETELNADRMLFNFSNGMLDLRTNTLGPHSRDQLSTIQFPFEFHRDATCPRWLKFLDEVFQGNESLRLLLQEIFGYVLIPDTSMQKMFWMVGEGANGKGVAIKVLEGLIDKSNRTCVDIRNLHNPFVRAAMHNKLLAVQGDFPKKFFGNEDLIKTFVGGDSMDAQEKFKPQFEFTPFCRFIFAMNSLPETKDLSKGFFRRVAIVPFTKTFDEDEQDKNLSSTLMGELPGIFLWALEGLKRIVERNRFTESPDALRVLENYKQDHNSMGQFVEAECVLGAGTKCKGIDLWTAYEIFCVESGIEALSRKEFAIQMKRNYAVTVKTHRWGNDDTPIRTYFGIGLKIQ